MGGMRRLQGGSEVAPVRLQGANCPSVDPRLRNNCVTTNEVTEDLSRRWARCPANFAVSDDSSSLGDYEPSLGCLTTSQRPYGFCGDAV